jgi:hypothetical protein
MLEELPRLELLNAPDALPPTAASRLCTLLLLGRRELLVPTRLGLPVRAT